MKKDVVLLGTVKGLSQLPLVSRESFLIITNIHLYKKYTRQRYLLFLMLYVCVIQIDKAFRKLFVKQRKDCGKKEQDVRKMSKIIIRSKP